MFRGIGSKGVIGRGGAGRGSSQPPLKVQLVGELQVGAPR